MALNRRMREEILAHCGEIHEDDGIDPRELFKSGTRRNKRDRKAMQLCRQVAETLDLVLSGELSDELLSGLKIVSVMPAPDSSRLLVTLQPHTSDEWFDQSKIMTHLAAASGRLRHAVAMAITRRKAPVLAFQVIAAGLPAPSTKEGDKQ